MIINLVGVLTNTENILSISEMQQDGTLNTFTVHFLNNIHRVIYAKQFKQGNKDLEQVRKQLINVWSNNQSTIPKIG